MMELWRLKGTILKILGIFFMIIWGFLLMISLSYLFGWSEKNISAAINIIGICSVITLIPGIIFLYFGLKVTREERELVELASYLRTYRRINLSDLARKLDKSEFKTEKILMKCVDRKLVDGFIDRASNEFLIRKAMEEEVVIEKCPHCGASMSERFLKGESVKCNYCDSIIFSQTDFKKKK